MPSAVSLKNLLCRFRRHRRGSAAVEFALVAPIFIALLFAIIEVALMFFASQVLETVTQASARYLLTGQAQSGGLSQAQFKTYVCSQIPALFTCANLQVNVQSYPSFAVDQQHQPCIDASGNFIGPTNYCPGNAGDTVFVQLSYQWPLFVSRSRLQHVESGDDQEVAHVRPRHSRTSRSRRRRRVAEERCNEGDDLDTVPALQAAPGRLQA